MFRKKLPSCVEAIGGYCKPFSQLEQNIQVLETSLKGFMLLCKYFGHHVLRYGWRLDFYKTKTSYLCVFSHEWGDQISHKRFHSTKILRVNAPWAIQQECDVCQSGTLCKEEEKVNVWAVRAAQVSVMHITPNHKGVKMLRCSDALCWLGDTSVWLHANIFNSAFKTAQGSTYLPSTEEGTAFPTPLNWFIATHTPLYIVILLQSLGMVGPHA